jgi:endonuclease G
MVINGGSERSNKFKVDKLVSTGSAKSADYTKSGYDRGHLCPAADMDFNPIAMEESFLMSNICPQAPDFNRGIWKELETEVRNWAKKEHKLYVVTGPVFNDNKGTIGSDEVLVPGYFFKILYEETDQPKIIAFVFPNRKSDRPLADFAVTIDEAEKLTGFDFFSQIPDELENKLESRVDLSGWFDGYVSSEPIAAKQSPLPGKSAESDFQFYLILISVIILVIIFVFAKSRKRKR